MKDRIKRKNERIALFCTIIDLLYNYNCIQLQILLPTIMNIGINFDRFFPWDK